MKKTCWGLFCFFLTSAVFVPFGLGEESRIDSPRELAPGVMRTIRPFINYSETFQWSEIPEIVAAEKSETPEGVTVAKPFDWARNLYFSKEIWCLQFNFKPIRFMEVDFPNDKGKMDRKTVWYMIYSVTNTGRFVGSGVAQPADNKTDIMVRQEGEDPKQAPLEPVTVEQKANNLDGIYVVKEINYLEGDYELKEVKEEASSNDQKARTYSLETIKKEKIDLTPGEDGKRPGTVRFSPQFILVTKNAIGQIEYVPDEDGFYHNKSFDRTSGVWNDQFLPLAFVKIAAFEDPNRAFENSITFPAVDIAPGETVWGIATWTDIDPRINDFTVYVSGLTNALRWTDDEKAEIKPDSPPMTGRDIIRKVLKLNFYRPGDEEISDESKVYFGLPGQKDFEWVYL